MIFALWQLFCHHIYLLLQKVPNIHVFLVVPSLSDIFWFFFLKLKKNNVGFDQLAKFLQFFLVDIIESQFGDSFVNKHIIKNVNKFLRKLA
jgi:hypothetical protein